MSKGFTLIELSIVLVIVGLLIGGVLVAESLISTSKISSQISQIQQIDASLANFETRYNSLPGDSSILSGTGDNDGNIEGSGGALTFTGERALFWNHLSLSGLKPHDGGTTYSSSFASGVDITGSDANTPQAVLGKSTSIITQYDAGNWLWMGGVVPEQSSGYDYYTLTDCSTIDQVTDEIGTCQTNNSLAGIDFLALDIKIDNGDIGTGNLWAGTEYVFLYHIYDNSYIASNTTVTSDPTIKVTGFIRMGSIFGMAK